MSKNFKINEYFDENGERVERLITYLIIEKLEKKDLPSVGRSSNA